jgi:1-acyl-sn-glycerol-3-phosphate acyltransferase
MHDLYDHYANAEPSAIARGALFPLVRVLYGRHVDGLCNGESHRQLQTHQAGAMGKLLISNHRSEKDPLVLTAFFMKQGLTNVLHQTVPIANAQAFKPGFQGWVVDQVGSMPIFRAKDAPEGHPMLVNASQERCFSTAWQHLQSGRNILFFPEGTRAKTDDPIHFKQGVGHLAMQHTDIAQQLEIQPMGIAYDKDYQNARVVVGESFPAADFTGTDSPTYNFIKYAEARVTALAGRAQYLVAEM